MTDANVMILEWCCDCCGSWQAKGSLCPHGTNENAWLPFTPQWRERPADAGASAILERLATDGIIRRYCTDPRHDPDVPCLYDGCTACIEECDPPAGPIVALIDNRPRGEVETFNLATGIHGPVYVGVSPADAVRAAHAQSLNDFNTWEYRDKYEVTVIGERLVRCGNFTALA